MRNILLNKTNIIKKILTIAKHHKIRVGNKTKIQFVTDRPGHDLRYALNSSKIFKHLGWKSSTNIKDGLEKTFLWYLSNREYFRSFKKKDIVRRIGKR